MKKDKKWAQKEVDKYLSYEGVSEARNALIFAKGVIDQLDEPEVLSQEWIERNTSPVDDEGRLYVWKRDLQNAIVPKPELPVIPRVVADYITHKKKSGNSLDGAFAYIKTYGWDDASSYDYEVYEWLDIDSNDETFARAWLNGYELEVEREQKYYVDLESAAYVAKWDGNGQVDIYTDGISGSDEYELHLTEQEIKDYDERYWPFAVKVEELE